MFFIQTLQMYLLENTELSAQYVVNLRNIEQLACSRAKLKYTVEFMILDHLETNFLK